MEIVLGQVHAGSTFRDERRSVAELADCGIELMAVPGSEPHARDPGFGERVQELRKAREGPARNGNEVIDSAKDDGGGRAQKWPPGWKRNCIENWTAEKKETAEGMDLPPCLWNE